MHKTDGRLNYVFDLFQHDFAMGWKSLYAYDDTKLSNDAR